MRNHQRDNLTQGKPLLGQRCVLVAGGVQQTVHVIDIGTKPDPETISQTMHLTISRRSRERHRVEVGPGDQFARFEGFRPETIGPHAGRGHLTDLLGRRQGQAIRRVAILLHLGRQGTATGRLILHIERLAHLRERGLGKTGPVDRRVGQRLFVAQQVAVLDKQQRLDDKRRNGVKIWIVMGRILELIEGLGAAIVQRQSGLHLLGIGHEEATTGVVIERVGEMHLLADFIAPLQQALLHHRQLHIAEPLVERAILREGDLLALARLDLIGELGGIAGDLLRLQLRGFHLIANQSDHRPQAQ